jgi:uncharacterized protein YjbJ (UPF0337 family)
MNRDIVEGSWKQFKGKVKARWTRLNDDLRDVVADRVQDAAPRPGGAMKEEIPSRRVVLRGALAVGCGLCLPIALSGCDSKKGATPAGAPGSTADKATQATANKVSQASVQYQTQPKGEQKCSTCANFIAPNSCKLVDGQISPEGWCNLWTKKA